MAIIVRGLTTLLGAEEISAQELSDWYSNGEDNPTKITGINQLYHFSPKVDLVSVASLLTNTILDEVDAKRVGGIVAATNYTHETLVPTLGAAVAGELGLTNLYATSLGIGCGGLAQAVEYAVALMTSPMTRWSKDSVFIVLAADWYSKCIDTEDFKTRYLFSDSVAGFALMEDEPRPGDLVLTQVASSSLVVPFPADAMRLGNETLGEGRYFSMSTNGIARFVPQIPTRVQEMLGLERWEGISLIPHQANIRLLASMRKHMPDLASCYTEGITTIGNTLNASTLFGLEDALRRDLLGSNDIILVPFGAEWVVGGIRLQIY